jgi:hypothetical protein
VGDIFKHMVQVNSELVILRLLEVDVLLLRHCVASFYGVD